MIYTVGTPDTKMFEIRSAIYLNGEVLLFGCYIKVANYIKVAKMRFVAASIAGQLDIHFDKPCNAL